MCSFPKPVQRLVLKTILLTIGLTACRPIAPDATSLPTTVEWLAFTSGIHFFIRNDDGSILTRYQGREPAWSPDGRQIAFTDRKNIYTMYADGSGVTSVARVNSDKQSLYYPHWSPDGKQIVFWSNALISSIYVVNADGSNLRRLDIGNIGAPGYREPVWSPDSQRIVYARAVCCGEHRPTSIFVVDRGLESETEQRLTDQEVDVCALCLDDLDPIWSPDGQQIAYTSLRDGHVEIYSMDKNGNNENRLTNGTADNRSMAWSPNGKQIVFASKRDGNYEIYVMNADGSDQTRLTNAPGEDWGPAWSPDGKQIAFVSGRDGNNEIYVMNADGSEQIRLTNTSDDERLPVWSPQLGGN